jgi:hypothetical protein
MEIGSSWELLAVDESSDEVKSMESNIYRLSLQQIIMQGKAEAAAEQIAASRASCQYQLQALMLRESSQGQPAEVFLRLMDPGISIDRLTIRCNARFLELYASSQQSQQADYLQTYRGVQVSAEAQDLPVIFEHDLPLMSSSSGIKHWKLRFASIKHGDAAADSSSHRALLIPQFILQCKITSAAKQAAATIPTTAPSEASSDTKTSAPTAANAKDEVIPDLSQMLPPAYRAMAEAMERRLLHIIDQQLQQQTNRIIERLERLENQVSSIREDLAQSKRLLTAREDKS